MVSSSHSGRRVLLVARYPVGGIRTYLRDLLTSRALEKYSFVLVAPNDEQLAEYVSTGQLKCDEWVLSESSPLAFAQTIARVTRKFRPAFIHSQGFTSGATSAFANQLTHRPHLLTVHDILLDGQFAGVLGRLRSMCLGLSLNFPDRIHCVTEDSRLNLLSRFPSASGLKHKVVVIPHGVDTKRIYRASQRALASELGCHEDTVIFGFLGRFMAPKGFRVLIEAVASLVKERPLPREFRILAVGSGAFLREDRARVASMGVQDYFVFWPYQPDVSSILRSLDCLLMPSLWEASGLLAMEAMVAGTPVIGSSCIGLRETLAQTPAVSIPPGNPLALSQAMSTFMKAPHTHASTEFGAEASKRFDAERTFALLGKLYDELCET